MEIHAGSRPDVFNKPRDLVNKIAEPLFGYGCNSWFTNIDLVDGRRNYSTLERYEEIKDSCYKRKETIQYLIWL